MRTYVWDATLLLHAQSADWGDVLGDLVPAGRHVTTDVVLSEIAAGVPTWVTVTPSPLDSAFLDRLTMWRRRCGSGGGRHEGEASVLAFADHSGAAEIAVIDDGGARAVGVRHLGRNRVHRSLWALCEGIREERTRLTSVARFCDEMLRDGIRWPFAIGDFETWASSEGLI